VRVSFNARARRARRARPGSETGASTAARRGFALSGSASETGASTAARLGFALSGSASETGASTAARLGFALSGSASRRHRALGVKRRHVALGDHPVEGVYVVLVPRITAGHIAA
jgi:hypothetical protein